MLIHWFSNVIRDSLEKYDLEDVVLPLPGSKVLYPSHLRAEYERVLMEDFGLSLDCFNGRGVQNVKLLGSYRHIVVRPGALEWTFYYPEEDLVKINHYCYYFHYYHYIIIIIIIIVNGVLIY